MFLQGQNVSTEGQQQTSSEQDNKQGNNQQQNQPPLQSDGPQTGGAGATPDKLPPQRYL